MNERPTGSPSTRASGSVICGAPSVPAMQVSVSTRVRSGHITLRGWPRKGATHGAGPLGCGCVHARAAQERVGHFVDEARTGAIEPVAEGVPRLVRLQRHLLLAPTLERLAGQRVRGDLAEVLRHHAERRVERLAHRRIGHGEGVCQHHEARGRRRGGARAEQRFAGIDERPRVAR